MEPTHFEALYPADSRFETIASLLTFVKEGNSCQLIGLPGVGRANIFGLLTFNRHVREKHLGENQKWFHFVSVDFSEVRNKPLLEATKLLFLELVESLQERNMNEEYEKVREFFKDALSFQDELVLFQGLKKAIDFLAIEKELSIVFLIERFEEYLPSLTQDFFSNLRILRNRAKYRFSVVFSLGRPLEDILEPTLLADFYEFVVGHTVFVPLQDTALADFRLSYLEKISGKTIPEAEKKEVLELTGGHGKLSRLCYEALLADGQSSIINGKYASFFLSRKPVLGALYEIWRYLTPREQQKIEDFVFKNEPVQDTFLEQVNLITNNSLTIPLLKDFLVEHKQTALKEEKVTLDTTTNTIKRGEFVLSDTLTKSEFRLLTILLTHEGEVIERNALVDAVWQEAASTAGVTEQAIDQLLFRLRKKVEEDPNNPQHILTIKGRGVKFVQ